MTTAAPRATASDPGRTVHRSRGGQLIICPPCRDDEHEGCRDDRPGDGVACHCKTCRPAPCETCFPPDPDGQNRKGDVCPGCFTQMPLSGVCGYCL